MLTGEPWSLTLAIVVFISAGLVIGIGGVLLTARAERIAQVTGLGQLLTGAVLIGLVTSLSGLVTSITAAYAGHASLAVSNSLGGIAAQTVFLAVADMVYRKVNLEHAAASEANLLQGALLIVLLALPMLAMAHPGLAVFNIHPVSILLVAAYLFGLRLIGQARDRPMWRPRITPQTEREKKSGGSRSRRGLTALWTSFALLAAVVAVSGWLLAISAISISQHAGLGETVVGGIFTAITTSLPELVVAIAAVRRGALALAVGDILGGNAFDVLFLSASDAVYRDGSIYAAISVTEIFWVALSILLVGVLLLGLLRREKHGIGNIGFESFLVMVFYILGVLILTMT
ncbi:MAG TPA: sodium:calcium antiporter [Gammaproteobacteria bacterium]|nr:sodium:calcium antiporter [Gammaproteobacteria bacterium]